MSQPRPAPAASSSLPPGNRSRQYLLAALVVSVAAVVYLNTLWCGFTWDDDWLILTNHRLTEPSERIPYIKYMLIERTLWRPLKRISLMADYVLWGPDHPGGFHATNIAFNALAVLSLWALFLRVGAGRWVATVAALLFAVHPLHSEAVANISHRKEPMSLLFYALGFLAYLRAREGVPPGLSLSGLAGRVGLARGGALVLCTRIEFLFYTLLTYLLGMMSKEVGAVMLPATVVVYEAVLASGGLRARLRHLGWLFAPFVPVLILFVAKGYLGSLARRFTAEQIRWITHEATDSYPIVLLIALKAFGLYAAWMALPWPLYLDRAFDIPRSLLDPGPLLGLVALVVYGLGLYWTRKRSPLAFFGLAWWGLNLLPVLNVIPLTHWLVAERFAYVPSAGLCLAVAAGLDALRRRLPSLRQALDIGLGVVLTVLALLNVQQNWIWRDSYHLWEHTLRFNPRSYRGLYGFGLELDHRGKKAEAIDYYRRSIQVEPSYPEPHYALGLLLLNQGKYQEAIAEAELHARLALKDPEPFMVIGNAWFGLQDYRAAAEAYQRALERDPRHADAAFNMANALYGAQDFGNALMAIDLALGIKTEPDYFLLKGNIQEAGQDPAGAEQSYRQAERLRPDRESLNALATLLMRQQRYPEARETIQRSLAIDPDQPRLKSWLDSLAGTTP